MRRLFRDSIIAVLTAGLLLSAGGTHVSAMGGAPAAKVKKFDIIQREKDAERHLRAGRYQQAAEGFREILENKRRVLGKNHLDVALTLLNLATAELKLGRAEKALDAQLQALSIRRAVLDSNHWLVAAAYNDLSETYAALGRFGDAARAAKSDIAVFEKRLGPDHMRLGSMYLRYAKLLRKAGRKDEAERAAAHGHGVYAAAPQLASPPMQPSPELPADIKTVTAGPVTAHFSGEKPAGGPLRYGVTGLWFSFAGDNRVYPFKPEGKLFFSDWRFDIFSPDGKRVLLLMDRFGPYHIVFTARLRDYLTGKSLPDDVVGQTRKPGDVAAVHENAVWVSNQELRYTLSCCGTSEEKTHRIHFFGYKPKSSLDLVIDYRPRLKVRFSKLPVGSGGLIATVRAFLVQQDRAVANPGSWIKGNVTLGAEPKEYMPSDDELLLAELGSSIAAKAESLGREKAAAELARGGIQLREIVFDEFRFRHADVMGSGRFYYASPPNRVRVKLEP